MIVGGWIPLSKSGFREAADDFGQLKRQSKLLPRRHPPLDLQEYFPRFRTGVPRAHTYIIAAGGAGSFGSPAFFSGIWISRNASNAITAIPAAYDGWAN